MDENISEGGGARRGLTPRRRELLDMIARLWWEREPVVITELAQAMHYPDTRASATSVVQLLEGLEQTGYVEILRCGRGRQWGISPTRMGQYVAGLPVLPVLGSIPAGPLAPVLEAAERFEEISLHGWNARRGDFLLVVEGESMWPEVFPGDLVWLRPDAPIYNGAKVAVHVGEDYGATLKKVLQEPGSKTVTLRAINPDKKRYPDLKVKIKDFHPAGIMKGLIRAEKN